AWAVTYLGNFRRDDQDEFEPKPGHLRQLARMGNPMVKTLLIPPALRDAFNFGQPKNDSADFAAVIANRVLVLDKRFGTCPSNESDVFNCNPNMPVLNSIVVPDILRFTTDASDGFPNGRLPSNRTADVLTSLVLQLPNFTDGT